MKTNISRSAEADAFTYIDLLAVLAVVAFLLVAQISLFANAKAGSDRTVCLYNLGALARGWQGYADDHQGTLVGNLTGGDVQSLGNSNKTWVLGWLDYDNGNAFPASYGGNADTNLMVLTNFSPLAPYLNHSASVFKCPADTSLRYGNRGPMRVRSYSLNSYVGERAAAYTAGYQQFKKLSDIFKPSPSHCYLFLDERPGSINDGWFAVDMNGFEPLNPAAEQIVDIPGDRHNRGANFSFVDGHVETWRWTDPRTMPPHSPGQSLLLGVSSPGNPDVYRIQAATTRKVQSPLSGN